MEERSIRIEIAGRAYPLTIHPNEEENVQKAVSQLNESIARLNAAYKHADKQDLLAMAALEVTTRALNSTVVPQLEQAEEELTALEKLLGDLKT
jgi:cell division protein ZapA (FtsZ GTPase activity inhibitor)